MRRRKPINESPPKLDPAYSADLFSQASSWADDLLASQISKASHYKWASLLLLILSLCLGLAIMVMVPLQKTQLVVVHQPNNGVVWVDPPSTLQAAPSQSQTESEIVNYVTNRESYSAFSYDYQYKLINLLSSNEVAKTYRAMQDALNPISPIARLGQEGTQAAQVEEVVFLDNEALNNENNKHENHSNLAQVNFMLTTQQKGQITHAPFTALVSWVYRGTPDDVQAKWQDWDGFTVTHYALTQRNVNQTN